MKCSCNSINKKEKFLRGFCGGNVLRTIEAREGFDNQITLLINSSKETQFQRRELLTKASTLGMT